MKVFAALVLVAALANATKAPATSDPQTPRVEVKGPRVHSKDLFPGLGASSAAEVDLGPTPPIGTTRVIDKEEIEKAFRDAKLTPPSKIPAHVRVSRKARKLSANDVDGAVKAALATQRLPRGATLVKVRSSATEVSDDYDHVSVDLPAVPHRAGPMTVQATVSFLGADGGAPIHRSLVPLDISLPPEAAFPDVARGAAIALVIRRGLVEVSVPGVAAMDSDIGSVVMVTLKPSGRVVRARVLDKDHAIAEEP